MFNPEPGEGMEYIIVTIRVTNLAAPSDTRIVSELHFRVTGERGIVYSQPFVVLERKELNAEFYGGITIEGEIPFEVGQGEKNLVLIYDPGLGSTARYLSLGNSQKRSVATATPRPSRPTQPSVEIIPTPTPVIPVGSRTEVTKFQITSTGVQENAPLIYKDLVVYRRHGAPDVDIFGYDLRTGAEFPLVQRPGNQSPSGLFGSYLVYTEDTRDPTDESDVRLLNYETGEDILIAGGPGKQSGGGIYGDLVTYRTNVGGGFGDLHVYNIRTGAREFIDSNAGQPRIWGHNIVWPYPLGSGRYNIKGYDLRRREFFEISSVNNGYQSMPDIKGSWVVWKDGRDGKSAIYEKNLDTGIETLVYEVPTSGELGRPVVADRFIAWVHGRGVGAHDIFVQNRMTGEIVEVSNDGPQQPSPTAPDIWEDTAVWMSWHTGNGDIYGATLK
jgi:beta propeller repeat protein